MTEQPKRAYMPHCDSSILHAPGACEYCDEYPDWQEYRKIARIAFSGTEDETGSSGLAPCPSTFFRAPEQRDAWGGNRTTGYATRDEQRLNLFSNLRRFRGFRG